MAQQPPARRRGLPRTRGGEPWPPAAEATDVGANDLPAPVEAPTSVAAGFASEAATPDVISAETVPATGAADGATASAVPSATPDDDSGAAPTRPASHTPGTVRRGLPRHAGGEAWPPAHGGFNGGADRPATAGSAGMETEAPELASAPAATVSVAPDGPPLGTPADTRPAEPSAPVAAAAGPTGETVTVRRGLPRAAGAADWPPADYEARRTDVAAARETSPPPSAAIPAAAAPIAAPAHDGIGEGAPAPAVPDVSVDAVVSALPDQPRSTPSVIPGAAAFVHPQPAPQPRRIGAFTVSQWVGVGIVGVFGTVIAVAMAVLFTRWLITTPPLLDFLARYPGEYHLPDDAPVGFPAWLGWQHFFNSFFMLLIIRTGLQVRREKRPNGFWSPKKKPKQRISLTLWLHQGLDVLWVVNGLVFIVMLFITGQWMRIVPTSWDVFPNAISALLQYVSLDWPTENGWVNYNSLQQLAYFTTVFVGAPLAIVSGVRMSHLWPKDAPTLNRWYPIEWARAVHFPVMLYFVFFIVVHVGLVMTTGAMRNLGHMYAATDEPSMLGFWAFVASVVVMAAAWVAARPVIVAPIAKLFGTVKMR